MKISILLPSLSQPLGVRAIRNLQETSQGMDYEIILVSPYSFHGANVVHVPEQEKRGCVQAYRTAYRVATGDLVVPVPDDWLMGPRWLESSLEFLLARETSNPLFSCGVPSWNVHGFGCGTVFGIYYPFTPLMRRATVEQVGGFYADAFVGGWVDPDLALRVWQAGGRCEVCPGSYSVPISHRERFLEGPHKHSHFDTDMAIFLDRWQDRFGRGWQRELRNFNINVPPALLQDHGSFINDAEAFAALLPVYGVTPSAQGRQ